MSEYFSRKAEDYLKNSNRGFWRLVREKEREAVARWVRKEKGFSLLDAGAGAGYYSLFFKNQFQLNVTAVDSTPAMVEQLKRNGIPSHLARLETLELDGKFENIVAAGVFEFIDEPERAFCNLSSLLKEHGRMILLVPAGGLIGSLYQLFHPAIKTYIRPADFYIKIGNDNGLKCESTGKATFMSRVIVFEKIRQADRG